MLRQQAMPTSPLRNWSWRDNSKSTVGQDSLAPFFAYPDKGFLLLAHTSNPDARQIQELETESGPLHEQIATMVQSWDARVGLVVGATFPEQLGRIANWFQIAGFWPPVWVGKEATWRLLWRQAGAQPDLPACFFNASSRITGAADPGLAAQKIVESMRQTVAQMLDATL